MNRSAEGVMSSDALKLTTIIGVFLWLALFLASQGQVLDFSALYTSGGVIIEGHRTQLFNLPTQAEFQRRVFGMSGVLPFYHLAYESLLFIPLAMLPFKLALWIWRVLLLGMLLLSTGLIADTFDRARTQVLMLSLALFPIPLAVVQGQDSILFLYLLSGSLAALTLGQERRAGVLLALALFKPHLVLPLAAILIWKRGYRFLQGLLCGGLAVFLLSIGITGLKGFLQMGELMHYAASVKGDQIGAHAQAMPNLRGVLMLTGLGEHAALILAGAISALLFLMVAWHLRNQTSAKALFPPLIALALLTSIHVNAHDLAILVIPVLAMLVQKEKAAAICVGACFFMPMFWFTTLNAWFFFVICAVLFLTLQQPTTKEEKAASHFLTIGSSVAGGAENK